MKHQDFLKLCEFTSQDGVLMPKNDEAYKLLLLNNKKKVLLKPQKQRDLMLHKCYMLFCSWLWLKMPEEFKKSRCPEKSQMYNYLKVVSGQYQVGMKYKGKVFYKFESISFGRMSNDAFLDYLEDQMNIIYTELLIPLKMEFLFEEMNKEFKKIFKELM